MTKTHIFSVFAAGALLMGVTQPAHALFGDDEARKAILDLRDRMEVVQNGQMQLQGQIDQLREQNAQLIGRIEQLTNDLVVQQRSMKDLYGDLNTRLAVFEPVDVKLDGADIKVSAEERRLYDLGVKLFTQEKYEGAADAMDLLVRLYPESAYVASAMYWRGNANYADGNLNQTVKVMDDLVKAFPKSARVADAQLTKAAALTGLNKRTEAINTLRAIIKTYPGTETAKLAQDRLKALENRRQRRNAK